MKDLDFSLLIPCFNEEHILEKSVAKIIDIFKITNLKYEIIFVDDKSSDNTVGVIKEISKIYPDWHLIAHEKIVAEEVRLETEFCFPVQRSWDISILIYPQRRGTYSA